MQPQFFTLSPRVTALFELGKQYANEADVATRFKLVMQIADGLSPAERRIVPTLADLFRDLTVELRARSLRDKRRTDAAS